MTVPTGFEDMFGPQVPRSGSDEMATYALASAAYRDDEVGKILEANNEWHESKVNPGRKWATILRPNLGEAFAQAVVTRMLGVGRSPVVQSFGIEPQAVVEHCLAANRLRKERDTRLTVVMTLCGLLFLPGLLLWLLVFQIRTAVSKREDKRASALATALLVAVGVVAVIAMIRLPFTGPLAWYVRGAIVAPVVGWLLAKQICERTAKDLRTRWNNLLSGSTVGARVPESVPSSPGDTRAERLRQAFGELRDEQRSNSVFYSRPQGHPRHGHALGALAPRRGTGAGRLGPDAEGGVAERGAGQAPGAGPGDQQVPELRRRQRRRAGAGAAPHEPADHGRLPQAGDPALGRHAHPGERQGRHPPERQHGPPGQPPADPGHLQQAAVQQRRAALPRGPVDPLRRPVGDQHARLGDRAAQDPAHRAHGSCPGAGERPVHGEAAWPRRRRSPRRSSSGRPAR